ncbi:MAG: isoprenylcysteine carboxylmethyltransferase family protein [Terracidiphilus sp.]|jgi:protein-S-isoprenylcysteine O-methyltransferase Ste14
MKASAIEFRLRMWIQIVIVFLGFWAPWLGTLDWDRRISTLAWLAMEISRMGIVSFRVAAPVVIVCGALAALLGAVLRVWGAAYLGYGTVHHEEMQSGAVMAAGPFRYVRNPLYLGGWFMMLAICLLMTPTGALFVMVLVTIFYVRLILGEEAFLAAMLGEPYKEYLSAVPRLMPRLRSSLPSSAEKPHWLIAILTEINPIGIFVALAFFSWSYDNLLMLETILVSFLLSMVVRGLMKTPIPTVAFLIVAAAMRFAFHQSYPKTLLIAFGVALIVFALLPQKLRTGPRPEAA